MQKEDREILKKYASGLIPTEEFERSFKNRPDYISYDRQLEFALNDFEEFNMLFWYLPTKMDLEQKDKINKKYISIGEGHHEHEEMLTYFHRNFIRPNENVSILMSLIKNPPKYFKDVDRENVFLEKMPFYNW